MLLSASGRSRQASPRAINFIASPVAFFIKGTDLLLCYIDESGTPDIPGNTSHYILAGLAIPVEKWKEAEIDIQKIKIGGQKYKQLRKNYKETSDYIHLAYNERQQLILDLAQMIASWSYARCKLLTFALTHYEDIWKTAKKLCLNWFLKEQTEKTVERLV
jgi:hypothetical protein